MQTLSWPLRGLPKLYSAGRYPMGARQNLQKYLAPTVALHLHEYPGHLRIGKTRLNLRPGDVTITPAGMESSYNLAGSGYHLCIHFHPVEDAGRRVNLPIWTRLGSEAAFVMQQISSITELHRRSFKSGQAGEVATTAASASLQSLLLWLHLFRQRSKRIASPTRVELALQRLNEILEARFTEPLTVPEIARKVGLSQNYLARYFKERYGMTIPRYLLSRRIDLARHLLATTDDLIKQIAVRSGLPDAQYFNKQFRRHNGSSPTEYRLLALAGNTGR